MATHPSVLAWRIPGMGEPGGLPSMGSQQQQQRRTLHRPALGPSQSEKIARSFYRVLEIGLSGFKMSCIKQIIS